MLFVLMGIPPAFTGWLARTVLGPLSRIYSRALQEYFDLPTQLASAGLKAIATLAAFGNLSNTSLSKEELRTCFHELMGSSNLQMEEKDLNRLTNFVFEKDPRYPNGPRNKPFPKLEEGDDSQEPRVDAARFAISTSFRDPISLEDMQNLFDSRRDRKLLERVFTPGAVNEALRDQPVLELPLWKKQLLGVPVEKDEKEILGEDMSPAADETNTRKVQPEEPQIRDTMESGAYNAEVKQTLTMVTMQLQAAAAEVEAVKEAKSRVGEVDDKHSEAMKDLLLRVRILEDSHAGGADKGVPPLPGEPSSDAWRRIESLESRNRTISAENQELKRQMLDLRQQQAQLVSRCDRQFKSMQELTTLLKNMAERPAPAAAAQEPSLLPTSCFTSAPAGSFAQRRI
ncbi:unnamed protein product [Effrenium voratum]|nr:unnamed protein product [Effrenium voratum]